jgi:(p)ppGpp synthase/HD superfamily hydrolase
MALSNGMTHLLFHREPCADFMKEPLFSPLLERALRLAARCHRNQMRKGSDLPYVVHPCAVMLILQRTGITDDEVLAAALLHDVVEDTDCTIEEIAAEFPPHVVAWVKQTSEQKEDAAGTHRPWIDRKREHLAHAAHADWQARAIILADKLHNLTSILYDLEQGEEIWERFNAAPPAILWYNASMIEAASADDRDDLKTIAAAGRDVISQLVEKSGFQPSEPGGT